MGGRRAADRGRVIVAGGSIAGLFAGAMLRRQGFAVDVPMQAMSSRWSSLRCATAQPAAAMLFCEGSASACRVHWSFAPSR